MRSTGEVMGWDLTFHRAFLKAQMGAGVELPHGGAAFLSIKETDKTEALLEAAKVLQEQGFDILATSGTQAFLAENGIESTRVNKGYEGGRTIVDMIKDGEVALVMNSTEGKQAIEDSRAMRAAALAEKVPYFTTLAASHAAALAMQARAEGTLEVRALQGG